MDLVLHIGLPKTGTTSIQRALAGSRAALAAAGVLYPAATDGAVPQFLHRAALAHGKAGPARNPGVRAFAEGLLRQIGEAPEGTRLVVLSAEPCSLFLRTPQQIGGLRDLLAPCAATVQVVIYLRRQDLHAASMFTQALRHGIVDAPSLDTVERELDGLYDYQALLENWGGVFGHGAITPRIFDSASLLNGDAVQDFFSLCGIDASLAVARRHDVLNPSMGVQGQALLLAMGRVLQRQSGQRDVGGKEWAELAALATEVFPGRGWLPDRDTARLFMARHEDTNEAVRRQWLAGRPSLFGGDFDFLPEQAASLQGALAVDAACTVIMAAMRDRVRAGRRGHGTESKAFFFEKKKQKTFSTIWRAPGYQGGPF